MRQRSWMGGRWLAAGAVATLVAMHWAVQVAAAADAPQRQGPPQAAGAQLQPGASGLPVPRFVSLKSDRVNMRNGPGTEYPTAWVYKRAGLPVEVVREFEGWRQVRDSEGATGWILQSFLSGRRTALIEPWELKPGKPAPQIAIRSGSSDSAQPVVRLEAGVIATVQSCDGKWCYVSVERFRGYIEQKRLWGVYPDEIVK